STDSFATVNVSSVTSNVSLIYTGLAPNATYYVRVAAQNGSGSATAATALGGVFVPLAMPVITNVRFSTGTATSLTAAWALDNPAAEAPLAVLATDPAFAATVSSGTLAVGTQSALYAGLLPNTSYYFKVKVATAPDQDYTAALSTATLAAIPSASATPIANVTASALTLQWLGNGNPAGTVYQAEWTNASFPGATSQTVGLNATPSGLLANTTYFARVSAINRLGTYSSPLSFSPVSTLANAPAAAAGGPFAALYSSSATVQWTALPAAPIDQSCEGYRVEASTDAAFSTPYAVATTTNALASNLTIAGILPGVQTYFRVGSLNWQGGASYLVLGSTT